MRRYGLLLLVAVVALAWRLAAGRITPPEQASATVLERAIRRSRSSRSLDGHGCCDRAALDAAHDKRPLLVCFGDSLTAGYGTDPGQSYPDYLQTDLDAMDYNYRVVNEGISGNTTKDGVERLRRRRRAEAGGGGGGVRRQRWPARAAASKTHARTWIRLSATLKASGAKVALAGITLPPDYGPDYIKQFNATYTLLAKKYQVPMLPFLLKGVFGVDGMMQATGRTPPRTGNRGGGAECLAAGAAAAEEVALSPAPQSAASTFRRCAAQSPADPSAW